jgi:hypothetical protein
MNNNKGKGIFLIIFSIIFISIFITGFIPMINSIRYTGEYFSILPFVFTAIIFIFAFIKVFTSGIKSIKNQEDNSTNYDHIYKVQEVNQEKTTTKNCEICGNELEEKDVFCSSCGCKIKK